MARARALLAIVVAKYAPLPSPSLGYLARLLRYGAPQLTTEVQRALAELRTTLPQSQIDGVTWLWQPGEDPASRRWAHGDQVELLAPFDPVVWDRHRFELLWGWAYRFEAYVPAPKRRLGYYALPLLWGDSVIGWANLTLRDGRLVTDLGFHEGHRPAGDRLFRVALDEELHSMSRFLR